MRLLQPARGSTLPNLVAGQDSVPPHRTGTAVEGRSPDPLLLERRSPHDGTLLWRFPLTDGAAVAEAVSAARSASLSWGWRTPAPARGELLFALADLMADRADELAGVIALETGKAPRDARGEVMGAVALGRFFAGEGTRMFGRTMPSGVAGKRAMTVREPVGVAALIAASNTPIANIAWKLFPALVAGNTVVIKAAETTPATAWSVGQLALEVGLPPGVVNVVQGDRETGRHLVANTGVDVVSFTGSSTAGIEIASACAARLARVSLELGGKNAFVVLDDADLTVAVEWAVQSAFSNAGQRCSSGSRIIVSDAVHDRFVEAMLERTATLRLGPSDDDDLGPVITEASLQRILSAIDAAVSDGQQLLVGGHRMDGEMHALGHYVAPTIIAMDEEPHPLSNIELFGPVTQIFRAENDEHALELVNDSPYGLTAAVHTRDLGRALRFIDRASVGVVTINGGTFGSEPHMPFGGRRASGNGTREPGTEALDVYTSLKTVYLWPDPAKA